MRTSMVRVCLFVLLGVSVNAWGGDQAWNPGPADGDDCVPVDTLLSWSEGDCIGSDGRHVVYFGTDCNAVADANMSSPEFMGIQAAGVTTFDPGTLEKCTSYCWRIDERCQNPSSLVIGEVWSFRTCCDNIKWLQPPDKTKAGMDIRIDRSDGVERTLADDFKCTETGPITDVHFWGSWLNDDKGKIVQIHLSIHKDIPADPFDPDSYSMPGTLLWEKDFFSGEFFETMVFDLLPDFEWWWDTYIASIPPNPNGDQQIWRYDIFIDPNIAFIQEGTASDPIVYWLDIWVRTDGGHQFGWKTSREHWNDDAVYANPQGMPAGWNELIYPSSHPYSPESIDMAFAITTETYVEPNEACCFKDGSCADLTPAECIQQGGMPQGVNTDCASTECPTPDPNVACCLPDGNCVDVTLAECKALGGTPQCLGSDCSVVNCPTKCEIPPITCPDGDPATVMTYLKGFTDNFGPMPDPSPTPDLQLLNYIVTCSSPGVPLQFDQVPGEGGVPANSWFGHTFSGLPSGIVAARLEIRARATTGCGWPGTYNDHISFVDAITGCTAVWSWSNRFENLPEAGGDWLPGDVETFCLDLDALPTNSGTVSVLSSLVNGNLRIRVDDDTGVDYVRLIIAVCPCDYSFEFEVLAGINENCKFTPPLEPASPSTELTMAFGGPWRRFDQIVSNRKFGHTFSGLPSGIVKAELELCVRAGKDIPTNDILYLEFLNPTFAWAKSLATLTGMTWTVGDTKKLILDLGNLPASGSGVTSVLGDLADGDLDVYIQNDTAVDYIILRYSVCCHETIPGDTNHDWVVNFLDIAIAGLHWLEKIPYP